MAEGQFEALWAFALRFYGFPGVQEACLALQDDGGADVPLAISLVFAATRGRSLEIEDIRQIEATISPWRHDVVEPLRHARRALRVFPSSEAQHLRDKVKAAELEAERQEMALIARFLPDVASSVADIPLHARNSMAAYAALVPSLIGEPLDNFLEHVALFARHDAGQTANSN